jgi:hypothetical protein
MNEEFEKLVKRNCEISSFNSGIAIITVFILSAFFLYQGLESSTFFLSIAGLAIGYYAYTMTKKFKGEIKGGVFWVDMIKENPENIVWIKPILQKNTVALVITLYKERHFQFLTKDGLRIVMKCDSDKDQQTFIDGIQIHLPNAQFGYSYQMVEIYSTNPENFINALSVKGMYTPISAYKK